MRNQSKAASKVPKPNPEQSEGDGTKRAAPGREPRRGQQQSDEEKSQKRERVDGRKRLQVGVHVQMDGQEQRPEITQQDVGLRDDVRVSREDGRSIGLRRQGGLQDHQRDADNDGWQGRQGCAEETAHSLLPVRRLLEKDNVKEEQQRKHGGRRLAEQAESKGQEIEPRPSQGGEACVDGQRRNHAKATEDVAALDDVIHCFRHGRMQSVPGHREKSDAPIGIRGFAGGAGRVQDRDEKGVHGGQLQQEDDECGEMKPERGVAMAESVVQRQRSGDHGPISAVGRKHAEGGGVGKEARQVAQTSDIGIVDDGMGIVEVKRIVKMIGVGGAHGQQKDGCKRNLPGTERTHIQGFPREDFGDKFSTLRTLFCQLGAVAGAVRGTIKLTPAALKGRAATHESCIGLRRQLLSKYI